jgi:hypothetical protein
MLPRFREERLAAFRTGGFAFSLSSGDLPPAMLFLLYSLSVLLCWFLTRKLLFGILLAVVVDFALYVCLRLLM